MCWLIGLGTDHTRGHDLILLIPGYSIRGLGFEVQDNHAGDVGKNSESWSRTADIFSQGIKYSVLENFAASKPGET